MDKPKYKWVWIQYSSAERQADAENPTGMRQAPQVAQQLRSPQEHGDGI